MNQSEFIITPERNRKTNPGLGNEGTSLKPVDKITHVQESEHSMKKLF